MCKLYLNNLKTMISISVTKNAPNALQLWKRMNCGKMGRNHRQRWTILRLIILYQFFYCNQKNYKKSKLLHLQNKISNIYA